MTPTEPRACIYTLPARITIRGSGFPEDAQVVAVRAGAEPVCLNTRLCSVTSTEIEVEIPEQKAEVGVYKVYIQDNCRVYCCTEVELKAQCVIDQVLITEHMQPEPIR